MKQYIGTKHINAKPMNRAEYNAFRGWELPANENGADEGYLVEYTGAGQKANTPDYEGYVSWSPKDIFEAAYKCSETFENRLGIELEELKKKNEALRRFVEFNGEKFFSLAPFMQALLLAQQHFMTSYENMLSLRIDHLKAEKTELA